MSGLCEGRVAIVTGAGRGVGREHALQLAEHGAKVVVNDLGAAPDGSGSDAGPAAEVAAEIVAAGGEAVANTADVSNFDAARALVEQAIEAFGRLDVLVNNAGVTRDRMLVNMTEDEWDAVVRINLKGTFSPSRHAAAHWRERSKAGEPVDARIINTTSASGIYTNPAQTNYGSAKMAVAAFTIIAARELERYGVTVNALSPAARTRLTDDLADELGMSDQDQMSPRWVAPLCVWLASTGSREVTGRVFEVSGKALAIAEGWRRGPTAEPVDDAFALGPVIANLLGRARGNASLRDRTPD